MKCWPGQVPALPLPVSALLNREPALVAGFFVPIEVWQRFCVHHVLYHQIGKCHV